MESKVNILSESEHELEVTYAFEEIQGDIEKEVRKQLNSLQVDGFRKGKVPSATVKKLFGDSLEFRAAEKLAGKKFWEISEAQGLKPISEPALTDLQFTPGSPLSFKIQYEVMPAVEAKDYTGQEIEIVQLDARPEEIEAEYSRIVQARATAEPAETVENEHYVLTMDLTKVLADGTPDASLLQKDLEVNLSNPNVNKELSQNAMGKKAGDEITFTFTETHNAAHHEGEEPHAHTHTHTYTGVIKAVKKLILPELTEEFFKEMSSDKAATEAEFREYLKAEIQGYYDQRMEEFAERKLEQKILDNNPFTPPAVFVNNYLENLVKREIESMKPHERKQASPEELRERFKENAAMSVRWLLLRDSIVEKEKLEVTDDFVKNYVDNYAAKIGIPAERLMDIYMKEDRRSELLTRVFYEFLMKHNTVKKTVKSEATNA